MKSFSLQCCRTNNYMKCHENYVTVDLLGRIWNNSQSHALYQNNCLKLHCFNLNHLLNSTQVQIYHVNLYMISLKVKIQGL